MPKNIVVCLDGTGNLFKEENSNVIKLFQVSRRCVGQQIAYYDPGVGTLGDPSFKTPLGNRLSQIMGAAFGRGLLKNVEEAYTYLMEHHEEGDAIFVFGFSRGAYTARALAAFINRCGLFEKGCQNLIPYAMKLFLEELPRDASDEQRQRYYEVRSTFRKTYGRRTRKDDGKLSWQTPIRFLGLWDTVKSYGWVYDPVRLPRESTNESVHAVRHAVALDEKRVLFPQMHWQRKPATQDVRELWFAGVHSDVGGGYAEARAGLAKISLQWMVQEARGFGLLVDDDEYCRIVQGEGIGMAEPDAAALQHESLKGPWLVAEALPRRNPDGSIDWRPRRDADRARPVPGSAVLHGSVFDRIAHGRAVEGQSGRVPYAPRQLPELTAAQLLQLKASKPVLLGVPPSCLLVPLTDGSGDVLMHTLTSAERDALLQSVHDDPLQVFQLLAQSGTEAMRAAVPPASLPPLLLDALHRARDSAASERLRILATAVESDINALLQTPWQESELRTLVRRVTGGFVDARQAVRWLAELERAHALVQRDAPLVVQPDQSVGALVARLNSARSAPASELEPAIDALLDLYGASLDAWLGTTAPPAAAKMKAGPREFTAQRRNLNAITALAEGRYAAMSQALRPEAGVTALMNACDGVVASIDSRAELAQVSAVFAPTLPTADDVSRAIANLTRFMNRRDLPPAQEEAMRQAGGYLVESLVTAALRLKTAPA